MDAHDDCNHVLYHLHHPSSWAPQLLVGIFAHFTGAANEAICFGRLRCASVGHCVEWRCSDMAVVWQIQEILNSQW